MYNLINVIFLHLYHHASSSVTAPKKKKKEEKIFVCSTLNIKIIMWYNIYLQCPHCSKDLFSYYSFFYVYFYYILYTYIQTYMLYIYSLVRHISKIIQENPFIYITKPSALTIHIYSLMKL